MGSHLRFRDHNERLGCRVHSQVGTVRGANLNSIVMLTSTSLFTVAVLRVAGTPITVRLGHHDKAAVAHAPSLPPGWQGT